VANPYDDFADLYEDWNGCEKCRIGTRAKSKCFFRGVIPADVLFIGEGPGYQEDLQGIPFVGPSGRLLDSLISDSQRRKSFKYCVSNPVLCRPCDIVGGPNRPPSSVEIQNCEPRILKFINMVDPQVIVTLGQVAFNWIKSREEYSLPILKLYHPSYILRNRGYKGEYYGRTSRRLADFLCQELS
jgi:DNA polymerase